MARSQVLLYCPIYTDVRASRGALRLVQFPNLIVSLKRRIEEIKII